MHLKSLSILCSLFLFTISFSILNSCQEASTQSKNINYVNPFIGTAGHGHTHPAATRPFGMVQLGPDNGLHGWDWASGYHYSSDELIGFSHTHLSGTGIGDMLDVLITPTTESVQDFPLDSGRAYIKNFTTTFSHDNEKASPGYYQVKTDNGILVQLTATERVGVHKYTFLNSDTASIILDLGWSVNDDEPIKGRVQILDSITFCGYRLSTGWANQQKVYFYGKFNRPFSDFQMIKNGKRKLSHTTVEGKFVDAAFHFDATVDPVVQLQVALSTTGVLGAKRNFISEVSNKSFNNVFSEAEKSWEKYLSKVDIEGVDSLKTMFYTALYHTLLTPNLYSDVDGKYYLNDSIYQGSGEFYHIYSLWDTFRAVHPLLTLLYPEKAKSLVRCILEIHNNTGKLPVWWIWGNEANTMIGYHAVPVIVDAHHKGLLEDLDPDEILEALLSTGEQEDRNSPLYREYGYIPADSIFASVSTTLEYAYDDWCIAQLANAIGKLRVKEKYSARSKAYTLLFDSVTNLMKPKLKDGNWKNNFDAFDASYFNDYTEGNAWQYVWFVPQNIQNLVNLMGGNIAFERKLDSLFEMEINIGDRPAFDVSGIIGQYVHGNEPSHHIPYLYNYVDRRDKTQERVHQIIREMYSAKPNGYCGNEDCGQMSAWLVFSMIGMYPVNPAIGEYQLVTPYLKRIQLNIRDNIIIQIVNRTSEENGVTRVDWNGNEIHSVIQHEDLIQGGSLTFQ